MVTQVFLHLGKMTACDMAGLMRQYADDAVCILGIAQQARIDEYTLTACDDNNSCTQDSCVDRQCAHDFVALCCEGDVNGDGAVDPADVGLVQAAFGCNTPELFWCGNADANGDGNVDPADVGYVQARFGIDCVGR